MSVLCLRDQRGTPLLVRCRELLGVEDVIYRERSTVLCRSRTLAVAKIRSNFLLLLVDIVLDSPQFSRVLLLVRDQGLDAETPVRLHRGFAYGSFARVGNALSVWIKCWARMDAAAAVGIYATRLTVY